MAGRNLFADSQPGTVQPPEGQGRNLLADNTQPDPRKAQVATEMQNRGYGPLDMLMMGVEPAALMVAGAIAEPIAGVAGILSAIKSGPEEGAETVKAIQEAMSWEMKTKGGKAGMSAIGEAIGPAVQKVGDVVKGVGDVAADVGGPLAGAATITAIAAIPELLGLKGTRVAKKLALKKIIKNTDTTGLVDEAGNLASNVSESLKKADIPEEEFLQLVPDEVLSQSKTKQLFDESGVPLTKGELSKDFAQVAKEQKLLQSAGESASEPFRQFKLQQSEAIKDTLNKSVGDVVGREEVGDLMKGALSGRKKLLNKQKTELYDLAAENAKEMGDIPVFFDKIVEAVPDADTLEDLAITAPGPMESVDKILTKYGMKEPTEKMVDAGFAPTPLTISNFERFRKTLNAIERGDNTGAVSVVVGPVRKALDVELDDVGRSLEGKDIPESVIKPLSEARDTVKKLKREFSPQSVSGRLVDTKKDGVTPIIEASKVHEKLLAKSSPVEETRRVVKSLKNAGDEGEKAIAGMQASLILDLIDSGFGTESRKISGIKVFNPTAFKRRLKNIGEDKVAAIFEGNKEAFRNIRNIDNISTELIPDANAVPKGSASVVMDLANKLGFSAITGKIGGPFFMEAARRLVDPVKTGVSVKGALKADIPNMPQIISEHFPGIAGAIGVSKILQEDE